MRILVTGATGFIGSQVTLRLTRSGHDVVGVARNITWARVRYPDTEWIEGDFLSDKTAASWRPRLSGIDAVVNCAGVLQDGGGDNLYDVHVLGPAALFAACEEASICRVIQISAAGADDGAITPFMQTKAEGDSRLMMRNLNWIVLRPVLVMGNGVYGGTGLIRGLAGFPCVIPLVYGGQAIQTVDVDDVAATVAFCLGPRAPSKQVMTLAQSERLTLREIVEGTRRWLGFGIAPVVTVPNSLHRIACVVGDLAGRLGWRSPLRTTASKQLEAGVVGDSKDWGIATGLRPRGFKEWMQCTPSTVQDRWHARLYFLKPLVVAALSLVWLLSGLIALGPGFEAATVHLRSVGLGESTAVGITFVTGVIDIILGLAIVRAAWFKWAAIAMLVMAFAYLFGGTLLGPGLWLDPLGPMVKVIAVIILSLVGLALVESR